MDLGATPLTHLVPALILALSGASAVVFLTHAWLAFSGADRSTHSGIALLGIGSVLALLARYVQLVTNDPATADFAHRIFVALLLLLQVSVVGVTRAFSRVSSPWGGIVTLTGFTLALGAVTLWTHWTLAPPSIQFVHLFGWRYLSPSSTPAQLVYLPLTWGTLLYSGLLLRRSDTIPTGEHRVLVGVFFATLIMVTNNSLLGIGVLSTVSLLEFVPPLSAIALSSTLLFDHRRLQTRLEQQVAERTVTLTVRQRELEAALLTSQRATGARSRLLAHVSHVLRSSLEGIAAAAGLLADEGLSERARPQLEALRRATDRLVQLVASVIEATRLADDHAVDEHCAFSPLTEFETALDAIRHRAEHNGLALGLEVAEAVPHVVLGDAARLRQLLSHLLDNAVRFTSSGRVQLRARVVAASPTSIRLRVEIEDTGPGLSPRAREQIFEPFAQRRDVAMASLDGHGLGLALAHAISERMGGTIGVESEQGRGSTFWFESTFTKAKENLLTTGTTTDELMVAAHGAQGRRLMGSRLLRRHVDERPRVLVVDSDVTNQRLLKALLSRLGFGCDVVASGAVALEIIDSEHYGLVLVDCATQADDGYETIRRLRAQDASLGQRLPVVALIAHAAAVESAVAAGANDQLSTPTDPGRLATVLARWISD